MTQQTKTEMPEFCCAVHNTTGATILIKRGEKGFWPFHGRDDARTFNEERGITAAQAAAMFMGSMFGFDVPAADPDKYTAAEAERIAYRGPPAAALALQPLGSARMQLMRQFPLPRGAVALAEYVGGPGDNGHLVRLANGTLAIWLVRGALRQVDPREAEAALAALLQVTP